MCAAPAWVTADQAGTKRTPTSPMAGKCRGWPFAAGVPGGNGWPVRASRFSLSRGRPHEIVHLTNLNDPGPVMATQGERGYQEWLHRLSLKALTKARARLKIWSAAAVVECREGASRRSRDKDWDGRANEMLDWTKLG